MQETTFVYVNLNPYTVAINGPFGGSMSVPRNKAVKGEYFARFALPNGPLTMMPDHRVAPTAIVFEVKPINDTVAEAWDKKKAAVDPLLETGISIGDTSVVFAPTVTTTAPPVVNEVVEHEETGEELLVTEVEEDGTLEVDLVATPQVEKVKVEAKKTRKKKSK